MFLQCTLVLLFVSFASAKDLCCFPKQYGIQAGTVYASKGKGEGINYFSETSADYSQRNMVSTEVKVVRPNLHFRVIQDFTKNVTYNVDLNKKRCVKGDLNMTLPLYRCIPDGPKVVDYYLGQPNKPFDVTSYKVELYGLTFYVGLHRSPNVHECSLVSATLVDQSDLSLWITGYFNYTLGIADPSVFDIPAYCKHGDDTALRFHRTTIRLWNKRQAPVVAAKTIEDFKSGLQLTVVGTPDHF